MEEQEQLKAFVSKINAKTKELRSQNGRLEAMVRSKLLFFSSHIAKVRYGIRYHSLTYQYMIRIMSSQA